MSTKRGRRERARARVQRRAEDKAARRHGTAETPDPGPSAAEPLCGAKPDTIGADRQWYIARTLPRLHPRAVKALKEAHVSVVVPRVSEIVSRLGRRVIRRRQLLLRNVFVGVRDEAHLDQARALTGVAGVVSEPHEGEETQGNIEATEMRPARLDPAALQRFVDALAEKEIVQPFGVKVGDTVLVLSGPFASFPGTVEGLLSGDRVKVGIAIFGRSSPVELGIAQVQIVH